MSNLRNYSYKDIVMLTASKSVALSFKANIEELGIVRSNWTPGYADELLARIETIVSTQVGVDAKKDLRAATESLNAIADPARRDLAIFKVQIEEDFKKEPAVKAEVLKTLGFDKCLDLVQRGNQDALVELLLSFRQNMTVSLRNEITGKGMNALLIDRIIRYANSSFEANAYQENQKATSKEITLDTANVFNSIYDEVISICKIASKYYANDSIKREQFTFSKLVDKITPSVTTTTSATPVADSRVN